MLSTTNPAPDAVLSDAYDWVKVVKPKEGFMSFANAILTTRRTVKSLKVDLVHGLYLTCGGFLASLSGHKVKVVSAWGSDIFVDVRESLVKRVMVKYALRHSKQAFASSIALHEAILKNIPKAKVRIVRFGPDKTTPVLPPKYQTFTFLSIRRSSPVYHVKDIIQAFEEVAPGMDARLLVQRPDSASYDTYILVWNSPMKEKMGFWDERPHEEMADLYGAAHVGVSMPESDGFSAAVVECLACGTPVIMPMDSDIELVNPQVAVGDGVRLAEVMERAYRMWVERPEQYLRLAVRSKMTAEEYGTFDENMQKAEKCYYELVE